MQSGAQERKRIAEEIWLRYLNDQVYRAGLIDENVRNRILLRLRTNSK